MPNHQFHRRKSQRRRQWRIDTPVAENSRKEFQRFLWFQKRAAQKDIIGALAIFPDFRAHKLSTLHVLSAHVQKIRAARNNGCALPSTSLRTGPIYLNGPLRTDLHDGLRHFLEIGSCNVNFLKEQGMRFKHRLSMYSFYWKS